MKPLKGYENKYYITREGRIYSLYSKRFLKDVVTNGYRRFCFTDNGISKSLAIHRLVALTYLEDSYFENADALHKDGNKLNCDVSNLYWGTHSQNMLDKQKHGTDTKRNKTHCPLGHVLAEPNLKLDRAKQGYRVCRTCCVAKDYARNHTEHDYRYWAENKYYPRYKPIDKAIENN